MKKRLTWGTAVMLIFLTAAATFNITFALTQDMFNNRLKDFQKNEAEYSKLNQVKSLVEQNFVGEYNESAAQDSAIKGYVEGLGDQWSHYLTKEEFKSFEDALNSKYVGIGISVIFDEENESIRITEVIKNSPAFKANIEVNDLITEVNGKAVKDLGYETAVSNILGEKGTSVSLKLIKSNTGEEKNVTLTRSSVTVENVKSEILPGNIGYVRIRSFDLNSGKEFKEKVSTLVSAGVSGIIFDVRFNGGGALESLVEMLDYLLPEGTIISMKDKYGQGEEYKSDAKCINLPMTVLVNEYSYSAAEFFADALSEYNKAKIVGEKTTGKGYSQSPIPLKDGSGLYLSIRKYFTPSGKSLKDVGVTPDYVVPSGNEAENYAIPDHNKDVQLKKALDVLNGLIASVSGEKK